MGQVPWAMTTAGGVIRQPDSIKMWHFAAAYEPPATVEWLP